MRSSRSVSCRLPVALKSLSILWQHALSRRFSWHVPSEHGHDGGSGSSPIPSSKKFVALSLPPLVLPQIFVLLLCAKHLFSHSRSLFRSPTFFHFAFLFCRALSPKSFLSSPLLIPLLFLLSSPECFFLDFESSLRLCYFNNSQILLRLVRIGDLVSKTAYGICSQQSQESSTAN